MLPFPQQPSEQVTLSTYSVAHLGDRIRGRLYFPGRHALPAGSMGFVRSEPRARTAVTRGRPDALPWRDYPADVLTASSALLDTPFDEDFLIIGCRNVLNEWGHQIRLDGTWWRRGGDPPVADHWPVLGTLPEGVRFMRAEEAGETGSDILTGLPLVMDGRAVDLHFLIANCSDVAHVFEVHPQGLLGPSSAAWLDLSNVWQTARDEGRSEEELVAAVLATARRHGVTNDGLNLHSIIAETQDGAIVAFAISGALESIGRHLVSRWNVANAILLDNGGSVGWLYCGRGGDCPVLLVGGANRREHGTAFLVLETRGFPRARMHPCLTERV